MKFGKFGVFNKTNKKQYFCDFGFKNTLIIGENGVGKSLLLSLIYFTFGIDVKLNNFEDEKKEFTYILEFYQGGTTYVLKRHFLNKRDSLYTLFFNDELLTFNNAGDLSNYISNELLSLNKVFYKDSSGKIKIYQPTTTQLLSLSYIPQWSWGSYKIIDDQWNPGTYNKDLLVQIFSQNDSILNIDNDEIEKYNKFLIKNNELKTLLKAVNNTETITKDEGFKDLNESLNLIKNVESIQEELRIIKNSRLNLKNYREKFNRLKRNNILINDILNNSKAKIKCKHCEFEYDLVFEDFENAFGKMNFLSSNSFTDEHNTDLQNKINELTQESIKLTRELNNMNISKTLLINKSNIENQIKKNSELLKFDVSQISKKINDIYTRISYTKDSIVKNFDSECSKKFQNYFKTQSKNEDKEYLFLHVTHGVVSVINHIIRNIVLQESNKLHDRIMPLTIDGYRIETTEGLEENFLSLFSDFYNFNDNQMLIATKNDKGLHIEKLKKLFAVNIIKLNESAMLISDKLDTSNELFEKYINS